MRDVAVRRLALRIPPGHLAASRQRAEDALHLAAPDETRLMLLRRVELGRMPARAPAAAWTARAEICLADQRARAMHAAQPGAETADAVWFHSVDEARELLLLLLASGRRPDAWFWRLAVPEWQGLPLPVWLEEWFSATLDDPAAELALARAVVSVARAGRLPAVVAAMGVAALPVMGGLARPAAPFAAATARHEAERLAETLLVRLDAAVRQALHQALATLRLHGAEGRWLARLSLVAAAPELAGQGTTLALLADAVVAEAHRGLAPVPEPDETQSPSIAQPAPPGATPARSTADAAPAEPVAPARDPVPPPAAAHHAADRDALGTPPEPADAHDVQADSTADAIEEQLSRGAGLFLVIRALERLGLGERLAADPGSAASGFGRHLLCHIATRARVPPEDPLFALLAPPDMQADPAALRAWRVGLDRWLRRRARLRLADLVARRGWLHRVDDTLQVRFPLAAADIRLRRLALDVDPNWAPWLGLSVRYHFRDEALG